jgi:hypothetical protein
MARREGGFCAFPTKQSPPPRRANLWNIGRRKSGEQDFRNIRDFQDCRKNNETALLFSAGLTFFRKGDCFAPPLKKAAATGARNDNIVFSLGLVAAWRKNCKSRKIREILPNSFV